MKSEEDNNALYPDLGIEAFVSLSKHTLSLNPEPNPQLGFTSTRSNLGLHFYFVDTISMEEPEKLSTSGTSESTVTRDEKVSGETLEESVDCGGQVHLEGSFSEELVGEGGACNGKDVMVEVLGSDVYIDGVCTRGSDAELKDEVGCGGSDEGVEDLDKDVIPGGEGNGAEARLEGSQVVGSLEARSENAAIELDGVVLEREEKGRAVVGSDEFGVASTQGESLLDNKGQKDVGTGVSDSFLVVNSTSGAIEVPAIEDVGVERMNALDAGVPDHKVTNTRCDNALGCSLTISSLCGENVQSRWAEKDNQQERNFADHVATEDGNDVTLKTLDERKNIANWQSDKTLEKEACIHDKDEFDEKLNSVGEQPMRIDKVGDNTNSILKEVDAGAEVAADNSEEKKCFRLDKCIEKERMTDTSQVSSDTGQGMEVDKDFHAEGFPLLPVEQNAENYETVGASTKSDAQVSNIGEISLINSEGIENFNHKVPGYSLNEQPLKSIETLEKDMGGDFALDDSCSTKEVELNKNVSDTEQHSLHKGLDLEDEDQPKRIKPMNCTADFQGTTLMSAKNLDAKTMSKIVEEDTQIADQGYIAPLGAGKEKFNDEAPLSADDPKSEFTKCVRQSVTSDVTQVESNVKQNVEGQTGISEQVGSHGGQEIEVEEFDDTEQRKMTDEKVMKRAPMKPGSSGIFYQASYLLPTEKEDEFSVSDMVWGKVRSHPWWPGQIFDPSDASEKAMKHCKKDCYLVAYFGDRTFAWNEASQLKPFRTHFSYIEKQSTSESFQNAVDCALDEVTRRVEFGLACFCIPKDTYDTIKFQTVENTGIQRELRVRHGVDEYLNASSFSPDKLIEFLKTLSELPTGGFDRLELVIAKAQLLAFYRLKGYSCLPELQCCGGLDNDMDTLIHDDEKNSSEVIEHATSISKNEGQAGPGNLKSQNSSRRKRKHNLKDDMYPTKKERSLSELMGGSPDSPDGDSWSDEKVTDNLVYPTLSKKRRTFDHYADDSGLQDGRKTISLAKVSNTTKQSFKIGECIRRVASQLTGSPSMLKCSGDRSQKTDGSTDGFSGNGSDVSFQNLEEVQRSSLIVSTEYSSLDDLLSSLKWVAQEPVGDYSFLNAIVSFFSDFRNSIIVADVSGKDILPTDKVGTKRKRPPIAGSPETFEFEDMSDTYWTDRVIENGSEEQPSRRNRKKDNQHVPDEPEKPVQVSRRSNSRKRYSDSSHTEAPGKPSGYIDEKSPAELVMNFAELDSVPSETSLNKMFRRFGPLKESETEVDRVSSRARVVFKKCADAEVACSSAKKFNIFGPILVNYQLNYTPSALFKASSVATTQDQEMHLDLSNFEVNMV